MEGGGAVGEGRHDNLDIADRELRFTDLRAWADALTTEFNAVKRDHEAGLMPYREALARHKMIAAEARAVAEEMRALAPRTSDPAPPISN